MAYKYPYISDKRMFAAVMYACKLIRETGYFNKAVQEASEQYNVNEEEIKKHIRARQAAGQKGKVSGRKYRWYILEGRVRSDADGAGNSTGFSIVRATNLENAQLHFSEADLHETMIYDYGGAYAPCFEHYVVGNYDGYATKTEAQKALKELEGVHD